MQRSASLAGKLLRELEGGGALFRCNTEGRVDLTGMPAGAGVELELQDRFGNVLAQRSVAPLAAGEERSIRLEATASLSELDIELHDASGRPLVGATVELSARGEVTRVRSDAQGTVRVWHAEPGPVGIVLKKRGFVSRSIEEQRLDQLPQPARFELEHGRNVVVEFPTGGAAGTSPTRIEAITADGRVFEGTRREEGWLMANVPRSALTLRFTDAEARTTTAALAEGVESFSFEAGQH